MTFNISTALGVVHLAPAPALDSPVVSTQLDSLPEELLAQIASHLLPPSLTPIQALLYGPFVGAYQDTDGEDFRWDYQLDQPKSKTKAQTLPSLVDLGSLRLVDRRWERASIGLLFGRVGIPSIERLEWLLERPRLAACVKWLDILAHSLQEKAALDDNLPEAGCVLQALIQRMPALRQLSLQGPIPSSIINALRDPLTRNILKIDSLQALSLVNQSTKHDDPDFWNNSRRQILRYLPLLSFLKLHPDLHTLHISGSQLTPTQLGSFLNSLAQAGIRLRTLSIEVTSRLEEGFEDALVNRLRCLLEAGKEMGQNLECIRLFGEHAEFGNETLHAEVAELLPQLETLLPRLSYLNLGFTSLDSSSPLLASVVQKFCLHICPCLAAHQVYWEEEKLGVEETHVSMVNFYSHRLGRTWVSGGQAATRDATAESSATAAVDDGSVLIL